MARRSSVVALLVLSLAACATAFDLSVSPEDVLAAGLKEPGGVELSRVIRLSDKDPRAFLYKSFLSDEECDHIVAIAAARLARSAVTDSKSGQSVVSEVRTSSGMFLSKGEDDVIRAMEQRVSEWTFLPVANQEALQVLRYGKGQKYDPHFDYFSDPVNTQLGGHRYATVLMYLNNVTKGGETVFPTHKDDTPKDDSWSDCAKGLLAVKPSKGDALLFFNMQPDGSPDPSSLHYACPVVEGIKWSAPKWIRMGDVSVPLSAAVTPACQDSNAYCEAWAKEGHCTSEQYKGYMVGTATSTGACRKACNACDL
ncbi:hypothetical protein CLOP_g15396 [Closterium sp. NIES-67]|nr:hypothetical protein CLOP_g15396 [Closterium sp. NIES-67]